MNSALNAILIEVIPDDPETDMNSLLKKVQEKLPPSVEIKDHKVEPFVFGLNKLKVMLIAPEKEGILTQIEENLSSIEGITIEILSVTRL